MLIFKEDSMEEHKNSSISILGILGIVFIVLKLCGVITWSWLWVLCPFWSPILLFLIVLIVCGIIGHRERSYWKNINNKYKER